MRKTVHIVLTFLLTVAMMGIALPAGAATKTLHLGGVVRCESGAAVAGIWVHSSAGGANWAKWTPVAGASHLATWERDVPINGSSSTVHLSVGCGKLSGGKWASSSNTSKTTVSGNRLLSATCKNPSSGSGSCSWLTTAEAATGGKSSALFAVRRVGDIKSGTSTTTGRWSGWCLRFVGLAWGRTDGGYDSAITMYRSYPKSSITTGTTGLPIGALAFWNRSQWGHVGIHVGLGVIVSTQGLSKDSKPILAHTIRHYGTADWLGWAKPTSTWNKRD